MDLSPLKAAGNLLRQSRLGMVAASLIAGLTILAALAPLIIPSSFVYALNVGGGLTAPSSSHLFGTDLYGRDLLQLCVLAINGDLQIAYIVTAASLLIGMVVGALSGYGRPGFDEIIMRVTDIFLSVPSFVLAMAVAVAVGGSMFNLELALIVAIWPSYARIVRGQVISEKSKLYVDSLKLLNISKYRILFRHIMPNIIYPVLAFLTLQIGVTILFLSGLSFLGFGSGPFTPELGRIISDGLKYFLQAPWIVVFPGLVLSVLAFSFSLFGDALRDILDPRLKNIRSVTS